MDDIELIDYQRSAVLERTILELGKTLYYSLCDAVRDDEVATLCELIGEFTLVASAYSNKTGRLREDLGVSLNEAASLKLSAIRKDAASPGVEWLHYADDAKMILDSYISK